MVEATTLGVETSYLNQPFPILGEALGHMVFHQAGPVHLLSIRDPLLKEIHGEVEGSPVLVLVVDCTRTWVEPEQVDLTPGQHSHSTATPLLCLLRLSTHSHRVLLRKPVLGLTCLQPIGPAVGLLMEMEASLELQEAMTVLLIWHLRYCLCNLNV